MKITEQDLWNFVWRANTREKIVIAEKWLIEHVTDNDLFDDLMVQLSIQNRNIGRAETGRPFI